MDGQPAPADMMRHEIAFYADMFNRMTETCFKKCVPRFHDKDLNTGENVCADRCVGKYVNTTTLVGEIMQEAQQSAGAAM